MALTLQQISQEKERIEQRLAELHGEYEELTAAERVLTRYEKTNGSVRRRGRPAKATTTAGPPAPPDVSSPKTNMAKVKRTKQAGPSLSDRVLQAAIGIPRSELKVDGARPNHVGAAIARHIRAGRMVERNGKLYQRERIAA